MNAAMLTNMFVGNVDASPVRARLTVTRPAAARNTNQFIPAPADNTPTSNPPETATTDKTPANSQSEPIDRPPQDFGETFHKEMMTEEPQKGHAGDESQSAGQGPALPEPERPSIVQEWLDQYFLNVEHGKEGVATKMIMGPKAGYELAQLLAGVKDDKSPPVTGRAAKSAEIKLLLTADKGQMGLKTVLPDNSRGPLNANTEPGEGKNIDRIPIPGETLGADSQAAVAGEKSKIVDGATAFGSQKTTTLSGKKLMSETSTADSKAFAVDGKGANTGEKTAMVYKSSVLGDQKAPVLDNDLVAADGKPLNNQLEASVSPKKSTLITEKLTDSKITAGQQGKVSPELSADTKEQAGNISDGLLAQKLNVENIHVSAGQTKDHSDLTSSNSPNSNFDQMLANNTQAPIIEQPAVSAEAEKSTNNASQNDVSASISEQILDSIYSSLRQGDRQITIRLNPPELGRVFIKFQKQEDQITGLLEVSKAQTRVDIQHALPQIVRNLADCGIQIKRLEVVLTDQPEQQPYRGQTLQDNWSGQQAGAEANNPDNKSANQRLTGDSGYQDKLTNDNSYRDNPALRLQISDNSINILI